MKSRPRGPDWTPAATVTFQPVPWKLMRVARYHDREVVSRDGPPGWVGVPFDPWKRGDLVVVQVTSSAWHQGKGTTHRTEWIVGRRDSVPSAPVARICISPDPAAEGWRGIRLERGHGAVLWRIPYRWHAAAARLIGQPFSSREALEEALT